MYMTASLGWPCEKTTFPFGYVATRRVAPADLRKASASKAARFSRGSTRRAFAFGIGSELSHATPGRRRVGSPFMRVERDKGAGRSGLITNAVGHVREELAQLAILGEVARKRKRGC